MTQLPGLIYSRDQRGPFHRRQELARSAKSGQTQRVALGAYLPAAEWAALDSREKYLARIRAVAETRRSRPVLSHWSAAAMHDLPILGEWPRSVHTTVSPTSGGRSRNGVVKHSLRLGDGDVVELDGLLVTSVARTVIDLAATTSFLAAVTVADHSLHEDRFGRIPPLTTKTELWRLWEARLPFGGHARAKAVIDFGESRADSPLESVSRVNMQLIGCPRPILQDRFSDYLGFIGETDFHWPHFGLVGEADGDRKYLDEAYRSGRTVEQVMIDEKVREDRLRALPLGVSRWRWKTAVNPAALRAKLSDAGLPMGIRW
ncbi:MAG: hypothetical protein ACYC2K_19205 [Gemmatimonadales bacterium]